MINRRKINFIKKYNFQVTASFVLSPSEMVLNQKPQKTNNVQGFFGKKCSRILRTNQGTDFYHLPHPFIKNKS